MLRLVLMFFLGIAAGPGLSQSQYITGPGNSTGGPAELYGAWGSAAQCEAEAGSEYPHLHPFEISENWIKQGWVHCFISWRQQLETENGLQVFAMAQCGEDLIREYRLQLVLAEQRLTIRWSDDFSSADLGRCLSR